MEMGGVLARVRTFAAITCWAVLSTTFPALSDSPQNAWVDLMVGSAPAGYDIHALGRVRFPDGHRGFWLSTSGGHWRSVDGEWQRWPGNMDETIPIRDVLLAPDSEGKTHWWLATDEGLWSSADGTYWKRKDPGQTAHGMERVRSLHLSQEADGTPVLWVGTANGLKKLVDDYWQAVVARAGGFHGGRIDRLVGVETGRGHQVWAAGDLGVSMYQNGQWSRPDTSCIRREPVHDLQPFEHPAGTRVAAATSRGTVLINPSQLDQCERLESPHTLEQVVIAIGRDTRDRLLLLRPTGVEKVSFQRGGGTPLHAWFDDRDGLGTTGQWIGSLEETVTDNLIVASSTGLWKSRSMPDGVAEPRKVELSVKMGDSDLPITAEGRILVGQRRTELTVNLEGIERPHAVVHRHRMDTAADWSDWQRDPTVMLQQPDYGQGMFQIEIIDDDGRRQGPWTFEFERPFPWPWVAGRIAVILALLAIAALLLNTLLRHRSSSA
jgi:hypothetical protein